MPCGRARSAIARLAVVGVYVGVLADGQTPCLKVMLARPTPDTERKIPREIEGYPVVTEISGEIHPLRPGARKRLRDTLRSEIGEVDALRSPTRHSCNAAFCSSFDLSGPLCGTAGVLAGFCDVPSAGELYDFRGQ